MIRNYTIKDFDACANLYAEAFSSPPWNEPITVEHAKKRLEWLNKIPDSFARIYEKDGEVVGLWFGHLEPLSDGQLLNLKELAIKPPEQHQGYGKELMADVEKTAQEHHCSQIFLWTSTAEHQTGFYEGRGFSKPGDILIMTKGADQFKGAAAGR